MSEFDDNPFIKCYNLNGIFLVLIEDNTMEKHKILVVDDDDSIRTALKELLKTNSYLVVDVSDGKSALRVLDQTFDLIILDVMMPEKDGLSTCLDIREQYTIPILFLTAKITEYEKFMGFSVGGDDYLEKPFSRIELLARISSLLRRYHVYQGCGDKDDKTAQDYIYIKDLKINKHTARVCKGEQEIALTNTEYQILLLLTENKNRIFTLENLYEKIWDEMYDCSANPTILVHIKNLRKKLGDSSHQAKYIKNIWGRGYCIENTE